jgi:hypothetical protein
MRTTRSRLFCAAAACLISGGANAAIAYLQANLDGPQTGSFLPLPATPGTFSPGLGSMIGTFDTETNVLTWQVSASGLVGNVTVAHFHGPAARGTNAGVRVEAPSLNVGSMAGQTGGFFQGSSDLDTLAGLAVETWQNELLGGSWYLNIHSTAIPAGEIRGQVEVVPIPAALPLLIGGLGLFGWLGRRRAGALPN